MKTRSLPKAMQDPRYTTTQIQARVPWWRRRQLEEIARNSNTNVSTLICDALDRVHKPEPPDGLVK